MKKYKVIATYVTTCEAQIEAKNEDEAFSIAQNLDGGFFEQKIDGDDWQIEHIVEIKG